GRQLFAGADVEELAERALEVAALVVGMGSRLLAGEQPPDERVVGGGELDHERRLERAEPVQEVPDRHVATDRDVVDESEAERQVGRAAVAQGAPLAAAPAESR